MATISTGIIGHKEIPITNLKPSHYRNSDLITLTHSALLTNHPEKTEKIQIQHQYITQTNTSFEVNHIGPCKESKLGNTV